jgi:hypothetical protein
MLILGIDPSGTTGAGYAYWGTEQGLISWATEASGGFKYDFAVVEGPWTRGNKMGRVHMWGLGFDAAWRLATVNADRKFILRPDEWRAEWGELLLGKPKSVIVARLRRELGLGPDVTDDCVEAAGIAGGWARRLARAGTKGLRRGCEVKR